MKRDDKKKLSIEEIIALLKSTTGHKKLLNYIKEIIKEEPFKKEIQEIRKKYNIDVDKNKREKLFPSSGLLEDDVLKLLNKYHLEFECLDFMIFYILGDEFSENNIGNMLFTEDIIDTEESLNSSCNPYTKEQFPVVIRVSPYASKRDIIDYIEKLYRFSIEPIQKTNQQKTTLGKVKKKKTGISERNDFIWENRNLPRRKIMELLTDTYGADRTIDFGYIGKIISLEKKKRKEV